MTNNFKDFELAAKKVVEHVGKSIVISIPLGIGKPIGFINALYRLALADQTINLTILTALTLARPTLTNTLEKNFVTPILDRLLQNYEDPLYELARVKQALPANVNVIEFFLTPGNYVDNAYVQQNYNSSTYTNAVRDAFQLPINVHAQQVAIDANYKNKVSLSCNSDLFKDIDREFKKLAAGGRKVAIVAEINTNLPFMHGEAIVDQDKFSGIIDTGQYPALFAIPRDEISTHDHAIGLYTSTLIKDDGCLQIGIGKLSNAVANSIIFRHKNNAEYQKILEQLDVNNKFGSVIAATGALSPFTVGLYASTEMLSDEYMQLYQAKVLQKKVYDHAGLQKLLNAKEITQVVTVETLDILLDRGIIKAKLSRKQFNFLQQFGIFKSEIVYKDGLLCLPNGEKIQADFANPELKKRIIATCLGTSLQTGKIMHAGFFVGSRWLYSTLKELTTAELESIDMASIDRTNKLIWLPALLHLQRQHARFVNSSLMVTLDGAVVSDGLNNYKEFSGIGGQFDFVYMATQLADARSIINCRSTRKTKNGVVSNIVWEYTNFSMPRFLRDIVVTEYGIADCRGKTDSEVIKALLNVSDSRFQTDLLEKAKAAGKVANDYVIPQLFQNNYPEALDKIIHQAQAAGFLLPYPFGSDLNEIEQKLARVLLQLKNSSKFKLIRTVLTALVCVRNDSKFTPYLARVQLEQPANFKEYIYQKLIMYLLSQQLH